MTGDREALGRALERVVELMVDPASIDRLPVRPPDLAARIGAFREPALAEHGIGIEAALAEALARIAPGMASTARRDFSLVIGGATPAAQVGDVLTTAWDPCVILHDHDSIAPAVEDQTALLLLDLFELGRDDFAATFTTGASASNLIALACARQWWGRQHGHDVAEQGLAGLAGAARPTVFSGAAHSSVRKALSELGMGRAALRTVATLPGRTAVDPEALAAALASHPGPAIVVANAGEVNTGDFDDLVRVAEACRAHGAWLHVDAAFGLFARCSPSYRALTAGIEVADSITADLHKLLNVPYDSALVLLASRHRGLYAEVLSAVAPYLGGQPLSGDRIHPMNRRVENSSRFRALPAWMTLKAYGRDGYRQLVERTCAHAQQLVAALAGDYVAPAPPFNIALLQGTEEGGAVIAGADDNQRLLRHINATGELSLTAGARDGKPAIRVAFAKWHTDQGDVEAAIAALRAALRTYRDER